MLQAIKKRDENQQEPLALEQIALWLGIGGAFAGDHYTAEICFTISKLPPATLTNSS